MNNKPPIDSASIIGRFGWEKVGQYNSELFIPIILRDEIRYTPVRIAEQEIIKKFEDLKPEIFRCINLRSFYITQNEAELLNIINMHHCDFRYGDQPFTNRDVIIKTDDVKELARFLNITCKIYCNGLAELTNKLGVVEMRFPHSDHRALIPYICKCE